MTTTINASTTAGLVQTADTSGVLALQTAGTTAVTVDASQNVGVGTASPASKLDVTATIRAVSSTPVAPTSGKGVEIWYETSGDYGRIATYDRTGAAYKNQYIDSAALYINSLSAGNVGIGTSSPSNKLDVFRSTFGGSNTSLILSSVNSASAKINFAGIGYTVDQGSAGIEAASMYFSTYGSGALTERMRITSDGSLLINGTTQPVNTYKQVITFSGGAVGGGLLFNDGDSGNTYPAVYFRKDGAQRGNINVTTSGTTYNTVSDYRLKEDVAPMVGALAKVSALKPVTYKWKSNGLDGQGFIAHELQAVIPDCVTGAKDATQEQEYEVTPAVKDEQGNITTPAVMGTRNVPVYQGIDTSFLVATLTAAIQEQQALITQLQADVAALKGATP
jgi:hypothetical protein